MRQLETKDEWNDIFFLIASSGITDERFSSQNFSLCTTKEVNELMRFLDRRQRVKANAFSVSTAKLCMVVIGALSTKKSGEGPKLDDFLPYSLKDLDEEQEGGMTAATAKVVKRLMTSGQLPLRIASTLVEQIKKFSSQQD